MHCSQQESIKECFDECHFIVVSFVTSVMWRCSYICNRNRSCDLKALWYESRKRMFLIPCPELKGQNKAFHLATGDGNIFPRLTSQAALHPPKDEPTIQITASQVYKLSRSKVMILVLPADAGAEFLKGTEVHSLVNGSAIFLTSTSDGYPIIRPLTSVTRVHFL